jgi:hypothetical protein
MTKFESEKVLPWISKAITNFKNLIKPMHHGIQTQYLQNYLNEFCFKYNRRHFGENLLNRLLVFAVGFVWN